ncbi:MAG: NAD(P)/FAD-dependent oxidoreductase [Gammaproteobacteria bacterium]|nr:NAD(P)/FAD-dependent oxidoreductase [Gammaproteobacteria bacterium]
MSADVAIVGGGLAGLTLALQLRKAVNDIDIVVLERHPHPLPMATPKVGESTVEIGSHYLANGVAQRNHLNDEQLPKFGLRLFFGDAPEDFAQSDELGSSRLLSVPTYQIDRGLLENQLAQTAKDQGIQFFDGVRVNALTVNGRNHTVKFIDYVDAHELQTRWLIDAAGRGSVLKANLGLARQNDHNCNAVWFRVAGKICVDDWSGSASWRARCVELTGKRWLSTNHLMGPGYWVWIIPLASGVTSVGIVADPELHPLDSMRRFDLALEWLDRHQPRCADAVRGLDLLDFRILRNYSHDCQQVFSDERWALSGESGVFLDPFYSPGTDFIAISNTFITDLIARELQGEDIRSRSRSYQQIYMSLFNSTLLLYQNQYPGFGDSQLMMIKTVWDYAYYWGVLSLLFFNDLLTDLNYMSATAVHLVKVQRCNKKMQGLFRHRAADALRSPPRGIFVDQYEIPCLRDFNAALVEPLSDIRMNSRIEGNVAILSNLSDCLENLLVNGTKGAPDSRESELLGDFRQRLAA